MATKRIKNIPAYTQTEAGPSKYKLLADWRLLWLVFRQYRVLKPVALHAHLHEGLLIAFVVKMLFFWRRTPLIADMQGSLVGELETHGTFKRRPYLKWPTALLERILYWCATHIICSNTHSVDKMVNELGVKPNKVSLSQDGANPAISRNDKAQKALISKHELDTSKAIIIYTGALLDAKGLNELKQLIKGSAEEGDRLHFLVIGYPTENLRAFINDNDLAELCTLTGRIEFDQLPIYLSLADIAVEPKKSDAGEGSGKMLNYLAAGLPVVAFSSINNTSYLPTGTKLARSNHDLKNILTELLQNHGLREKYAADNLRHFETNYSWDVTRKQLDTIYKKFSIS